MARELRQLELPHRTWGGRRAGAGRKAKPGRRCVPHRRRLVHDRRCPVHATLRVRPGLPSLRRDDVFGAMRRAFARGSNATFRLLQFSVQADHVHLLVEGDGHIPLQRGLQGLAIRTAKAINRMLRLRGRVWADRYHARELTSPREVRHALVYVLQNFRKHLNGALGVDTRSSAAWFAGWRNSRVAPVGNPPIVAPRTWLAAVGWRRHGLISIDEAPRAPTRRRRR